MSGKIQAPRGTFDVLGEDALARDRLEQIARGILEPAGYERIETPTFEATALFARGVGESTDVVQKEMYTFDSGDGSESLTLRPEGTAPVCRAYMEHGMHKLPQPVKLWYLSSYFRRERPQKGRYRQFWQLGVEAIGSDDPAVDAETILLLSEILDALGARGLRLRLAGLELTLLTAWTYRLAATQPATGVIAARGSSTTSPASAKRASARPRCSPIVGYRARRSSRSAAIGGMAIACRSTCCPASTPAPC